MSRLNKRTFIPWVLFFWPILLCSIYSHADSALQFNLFDETGISKGVCAILGADSVELGVEIAKTGDYFVHVIDPQSEQIEKAQHIADVSGLYGNKITVEKSSFSPLPYVNNFLDFVIIANADKDNLSRVPIQEIMRVLRPEGYVIIGNPDPKANFSIQDIRKLASKVDLINSKVIDNSKGKWLFMSKPLNKGIDDWRMWEHGPDNNPVSTDEIIRSPFMTQWLGTPFYNTMPMITTASGGRLFLAMGHIAHHRREEPWLNTLLARNGYNGTILWNRKLPDGYLVHRSAYIATPETFYMIDMDGSGCLMLDPETGSEQGKIEIPDIRGEWKWISMVDGMLYAMVGKQKDPAETTIVRSEFSHWSWGELSKGYYADRVPWGFGETLLAYDLKEKKLLWTHSEEKSIDSRSLSIGGGRLYFYGPDSHVACLDLESGNIGWKNDDPDLIRLIEEKGRGLGSTPGFRSMCFSLYTPAALYLQAQTRQNLVAVSLKDGRYLWSRQKTTNNPNMLFTDGMLYAGIGPDGNTLELDPLTGETKRDLGFKKRSCARLTATLESFFCRGWNEGMTRYDRKTGQIQFNGAFRLSCNDGMLPANGLIYTGPWPCDCNLSLMGHISLCSAGDFSFENNIDLPGRLEYGSGDALHVDDFACDETDWHTYRSNNKHNSSSSVSIPERIMKIWEYNPKFPFQATAPTSAGGLLFIGGDDGKIRAIDSATGKVKWIYRTGGTILQPPSIWNGRVYVGSSDGSIYALEATTGRLLWRFRASPIERRTMVYNSLSSTWPVHSGVLVQDGIAYAAAGIIDYDGTFVYALDAITGKVIWHNSSSGHLDRDLRKGISAQGTMTILKDRLWMAGGNVISPAIYDLKTGDYLGAKPVDGSPQSNRGEEIGVIGESILQGGKLRYTTGENVVNPAHFDALTLDSKGNPQLLSVLHQGKIPPAWNDQIIVYTDSRNTIPKCSTIDNAITSPAQRRRSGISKNVWQADSLYGSDAVSLALAKNALLTVNEIPRQRWLETRWRLNILNIKDGSAIGHHDLSSPAQTGGLLIDRDGKIIVIHEGGNISCFGDLNALRQYASSLANEAGAEEGKRYYRRTLISALNIVHDPDARSSLIRDLKEIGVDVGIAAQQAGYIVDWNILDPIPWDIGDPHSDETVIGAPDLIPDRTYQIKNIEYTWNSYRTHLNHGAIDLDQIFGECNNSAIYAYAEFECAITTRAQLMIGSNDGYRCWLNGEIVGTFDGGRAYRVDEDNITVTVHKGLNRILLKVTQHGNAWAYGVRLLDQNGCAIVVQ